MRYLVELSATRSMDAPASRKSIVGSLAEASKRVRQFIDAFNLGAGCSATAPAFTGGAVFAYEGPDAGKQVARVSYNGRVWDMAGKEIQI